MAAAAAARAEGPPTENRAPAALGFIETRRLAAAAAGAGSAEWRRGGCLEETGGREGPFRVVSAVVAISPAINTPNIMSLNRYHCTIHWQLFLSSVPKKMRPSQSAAEKQVNTECTPLLGMGSSLV